MPSEEPIPIAVVDSCEVVREGVAALLARHGGFSLVVSACDGEDYIRQSKGRGVQLALVEMHMPRMDGCTTIAWIRAHQPQTFPVAFTHERHPDAVRRAMRAGARGYVCKDLCSTELVAMLGTVVRSGLYYNELVQAYLLAPVAGAAPPRVAPADRLALLSEREREVFNLVVQGLTFKRIALRLSVALSTVESHRKNIYTKLELKGRGAIVRYAATHGLLR